MERIHRTDPPSVIRVIWHEDRLGGGCIARYFDFARAGHVAAHSESGLPLRTGPFNMFWTKFSTDRGTSTYGGEYDAQSEVKKKMAVYRHRGLFPS